MVKLNNVPRHVAIIPDGNRRWAKLKGKEGSFGHRKAISDKKLKELYICAKKNGVNVLSLWGFSTENWKRLSVEKKVLFEIFEEILLSIRDDPDFSIVRFVHFGRKDRLPDKVVKLLIELEEKTVSNTEFTFCLALDYGGKDEILRACSRLFKSAEEFSEEKFLLNLDTGIKGVSNVDLLIRTSGECRISGFMPIQSAYAEIFFEDKMFPDFGVSEFEKALLWFSGRKRRFGGN